MVLSYVELLQRENTYKHSISRRLYVNELAQEMWRPNDYDRNTNTVSLSRNTA